MSDHKAEAEAIMDNLAAPASDPHGAALVHATLFLAEQQRIANLLTYQASGRGSTIVLALINEGLGL